MGYPYPETYAPQDLTGQIGALCIHFPELSPDRVGEFVRNAMPTLKLPVTAEFWAAIPRWEATYGATTYNAALERVLDAIASTRKLANYRYLENELGPNRLRQCARTVRAFERIAETQPGDILLVPVQFGMMHRGHSMKGVRTLIALLTDDEFGLGAFEVGAMLLANPGRLVAHDNLWVDCPGDEYDPRAVGDFSEAPRFYFGGGRLEFDTVEIDCPRARSGSATGFIPPC